MTVKPPKDAKHIPRYEFFNEIIKHRKQIREELDRADNDLLFYGGLVKRSFSTSDIDMGFNNFSKNSAERVKRIVNNIIEQKFPDCKNISGSANPEAFGKAVAHLNFADIEEHYDNLEAVLMAFDAVKDTYKDVLLHSKLYDEIGDELEQVIRQVTDGCSERKDIDSALECARTELHNRRNDLSPSIKEETYKAAGREVPIRMRAE